MAEIVTVTVCSACKATLDAFLARATDAENALVFTRRTLEEERETLANYRQRSEEHWPTIRAQVEAIKWMGTVLLEAAGLDGNDLQIRVGGPPGANAEAAVSQLRQVAKEAELLVARLKELGL